MSTFKDVNEAYATYFEDDAAGRTNVGVSSLPLGAESRSMRSSPSQTERHGRDVAAARPRSSAIARRTPVLSRARSPSAPRDASR
jgi:hypothetical protein